MERQMAERQRQTQRKTHRDRDIERQTHHQTTGLWTACRNDLGKLRPSAGEKTELSFLGWTSGFSFPLQVLSHHGIAASGNRLTLPAVSGMWPSSSPALWSHFSPSPRVKGAAHPETVGNTLRPTRVDLKRGWWTHLRASFSLSSHSTWQSPAQWTRLGWLEVWQEEVTQVHSVCV